MIYQDMMLGKHPYHVSLGPGKKCSEHLHPDIELTLCIRGSYEMRINKKNYRILPNQLTFTGSMIPHSMIGSCEPDTYLLLIELGPVLLLEYFEPFSKAAFEHPVFSLDQCDPKLSELLYETARICKNRNGMSELLIKGNLHKICYYLYQEFIIQSELRSSPEYFRDIQKVEEAIELIHSQYHQPLTIAYVASLNQYSESHFCKIFKRITGITFHDALSRCRIKNACCLLRETTSPIAEIALQVGYTDTKSFSRVFKQYTGFTPRNYRSDPGISLTHLRF